MLKKWHLHGAIAGVKNSAPFKRNLRALKRRLRPYTPLDGNDDYYLDKALEMLRAVRAAGSPMRGAYLEIGAGWTPMLSLVFRIAGFDEIHLCDVERYLDGQGVVRAQEMAVLRLREICDAADIPPETAAARIQSFSYTYHCPMRLADMPDDNFAVVVSRAVLEHVPADALAGLHANLIRTLQPGGIACHCIDNSDHFEHRDKSISRLNFLQYSPRAWRWIERLTGESQNRLRHDDHAQILAEAGFQLVADEGAADPRTLARISGLRLASEFAGQPPERLAILESTFVLRKPQHKLALAYVRPASCPPPQAAGRPLPRAGERRT